MGIHGLSVLFEVYLSYAMIIYVKIFLYPLPVITWHIFASQLSTTNVLCRKVLSAKFHIWS